MSQYFLITQLLENGSVCTVNLFSEAVLGRTGIFLDGETILLDSDVFKNANIYSLLLFCLNSSKLSILSLNSFDLAKYDNIQRIFP